MNSLRWLSFLFAAISPALAQTTPRALPFAPAQVLAVLPAAPAAWIVIRSEADTSLGEWLETKATRTFQSPPVPSTGADTLPASPAGQVEISVIDTASFAPSLAAFSDFKPGQSGLVEKKLLGSLPAIVISGEGGHQLTQVLVSARYLVEIALTHLPQQHAEDWLRTLHFDLLPQKAATLDPRTREFRLSHIDELHPENNRSYLVSTTSSKRVNDFLQTLPLDSSAAVSTGQDAGNPSP